MIGLLAFAAVFGLALYWFQVHAWYERTTGRSALSLAGAPLPIAEWRGIDAATSPLKLRGCFRVDPAAFAAAAPARDATPLTAPSWFDCFDARAIGADLAAGRAAAYALERDAPEGFDVMAAIYPDGRGYLWRQLGAAYRDPR